MWGGGWVGLREAVPSGAGCVPPVSCLPALVPRPSLGSCCSPGPVHSASVVRLRPLPSSPRMVSVWLYVTPRSSLSPLCPAHYADQTGLWPQMDRRGIPLPWARGGIQTLSLQLSGPGLLPYHRPSWGDSETLQGGAGPEGQQLPCHGGRGITQFGTVGGGHAQQHCLWQSPSWRLCRTTEAM